jgi:hypothetical protein
MSARDQQISAGFSIHGYRLTLIGQRGAGPRALRITGLGSASDEFTAQLDWILPKAIDFLELGVWPATCLVQAARKSRTFAGFAPLFRALQKLEGRW